MEMKRTIKCVNYLFWCRAITGGSRGRREKERDKKITWEKSNCSSQKQNKQIKYIKWKTGLFTWISPQNIWMYTQWCAVLNCHRIMVGKIEYPNEPRSLIQPGLSRPTGEWLYRLFKNLDKRQHNNRDIAQHDAVWDSIECKSQTEGRAYERRVSNVLVDLDDSGLENSLPAEVTKVVRKLLCDQRSNSGGICRQICIL